MTYLIASKPDRQTAILGVGLFVLQSLDDESVADRGLEERIVAAGRDVGAVGGIPLCRDGWDIRSGSYMDSPSQRHSRKT